MNRDFRSGLRSCIQSLARDERGGVLIIMALMTPILLGMAGVVVDFGHVFFCYHELQESCDAAALAGAWALPGSNATATATLYSSASGGANAHDALGAVNMSSGYPMVRCLTTLQNEGMACTAPAGGNALTVKQEAAIPLWFGPIFGVNSFNISAISTASMRGSTNNSPYNVAIIVDMTVSMGTTDTNCGSVSRLNCSLQGVQTLLQTLSPCASSQKTCSVTNGVASSPIDQVSLFMFPNVTVGTESNITNCSGSSPTTVNYSLPSSTGTTYAPTGTSTPSYQITPFLSDYRTSDASSAFNSVSTLARAVGGISNCPGLQHPGYGGTYYAGAIYAAQAALTAQQAANAGTQNVIILVSDGDATVNSGKMATQTDDGVPFNKNGTYPSNVDECGQAILAAHAAAKAGTRVYAVAYGSEASGCPSDTTAAEGYLNVTPCQTMQNIASSPQYFFSDYNQSGSGSTCQSASQPTANLNQIFTQIAQDLTFARLIPDNTP
jgi:hypothetical protein